MDKRIIIAGVAGSLILGGGVMYFGATEKVTLENPQVIVWNKPTTDEEWAEDVKHESLDRRSTEVLEKMKVAHEEKLLRVIEGKREELECPECLRFKLKQRFEADGLKGRELTDAIEENYLNEVAQANWEIEKLKQSVERMDKELELRAKGFVMVEGEEVTLLGGLREPYAIRKIND